MGSANKAMLHSRSTRSAGAHANTVKHESRKSRFVGTVPQPFKFDIRDKVRPKTIRERKVEEMVEEQKVT